MRSLLSLLLATLLPLLCAHAAAPVFGDNPTAAHRATVNGISLYYETYGEGAPLVLLHGNGGSIASLSAQVAFFSTHRRVIAIDSRAHGHSSMDNQELTYDLMADDVAALLAELKTGPADILGWSDGGIVALAVAIRHPSSVRRLAISGANTRFDALSASDLKEMRKDLAEIDTMLAKGDKSRDWPRLRQYTTLMLFHPNMTRTELASIQVPVLVMAGDHDMIPEPHTREIAASLPHSTLHIFKDASHSVPREKASLFNATVEDFLSKP
jgi:pimeloyl-ACP methyl ester carboxylesterase